MAQESNDSKGAGEAAGSRRASLPQSGTPWPELQKRMSELAEGDVDWRQGRTAVYVFNAGEDVLTVAKEAYALFQSENALGPAAFPSLRTMESAVVDMGLELLQAPEGACGNMTSGGSESIFLAVKACREAARESDGDSRRTQGGEIIIPRSAHPAFDKAAHVLGLRVVRVAVADDLRADVAAMAAAINERTLMLVGSAPCFPFGLIDPIDELSALALERDLWLHVDACVGGYFAPFAGMNGVPLQPFDFAVEGVRTISADLHKYGYAAKGASTLLHRNEAQREGQVFHFDDWPGGGMTTPTAAGTRPGGAIAAAWAVMNYLGVAGYCEKARQVCEARAHIEQGVRALGFSVHGEPRLGLVAFGSDEIDSFGAWAAMHKRGWFTGLVTEPRGIHLMLSPAHAKFADEYLRDLEAAVAALKAGTASGSGVEARYS